MVRSQLPALPLLALCLATQVMAQTTGSVTGVAVDSISRRPLPSAMVQLVPADSSQSFTATATTDSAGRYRVDGVPTGRYLIGFYHPLLDTLGIEVPVREIRLSGQRAVRADLGVPSPATVRTAWCGERPRTGATTDSGGVVFGALRDVQSGRPVAGVRVTADWIELAVDERGMRRRIGSRTDSTTSTGGFALCDVPSGGLLALYAVRGADSTDLLDLQVPAHGILRRDLMLASRAQAGTVRLTGTVLRAGTTLPVAGAEVRLGEGAPVRTDEQGRWTLATTALGTRMLDVRAVGYTRSRRVVDAVADAEPVAIDLYTVAAVLDTVRVRAPRLASQANNGFDERRRSTTGRFITADDVAKRQVLMVSDLLRQLPGMRSWPTASGTQVLLRGPLEDWCAPLFFVNGQYIPEIDGDDLDARVRPDEVAGIEIYVGAGTPARFTMGMGGPACGSVVIWTKPRAR